MLILNFRKDNKIDKKYLYEWLEKYLPNLMKDTLNIIFNNYDWLELIEAVINYGNDTKIFKISYKILSITHIELTLTTKINMITRYDIKILKGELK